MGLYDLAATVELEAPVGDGVTDEPTDAAEPPAGAEGADAAEPVVLTFAEGLPGFPGCTAFVLTDVAPDSAFQVLQCLQDAEVSMIVTVPWLFFPDYTPDLGEEDREGLGLETPEDAIVFTSVTLAPEDDTVYLNLMGPFVVNRHTLQGRQLVLADSEHPTRAAVRLAEL